MTGHDLDLDAIRSVSENGNVRANRDQVRALCAKVESLRAKLDSAGRALAVMQNHEIRADQAEAKLTAAEQERDAAREKWMTALDMNARGRERADRAEAALAAVRELADRTLTFGGSDIEGWVNLSDLRRAPAAAEQDENVLSELVGRVQWACSQITDALADSRVIANPATAAWLRTIRDTLANASGDIPVAAAAEQPEPTPEQP